MKLKYVKFSDERNKRFCIKTIIGKQNDLWKVKKEAVYEEGKEHIISLKKKAELLKNYFMCDVCPIQIIEDVAEFDYIQGESMAERYINAIETNDTERFRRLLLEHKQIILGREENCVDFQSCKEYMRIFGEEGEFVGKKALRCCNYDAIASNIIYVNNNPVFIDYEWVFDFPVPIDVVLYHCILDFYLHYEKAEELLSLDEAMHVLGVECGREYLDKTYRSFYNYVIKDEQQEGYALMKAICLKRKKTLEEIEKENLVNLCECDRLQGVISGLNKEIVRLDKEYRDKDAQLYDAQVKEQLLQQQVEDVRKELKRISEEAFIQKNELENVQGELKRVSEEAFVQSHELKRVSEEAFIQKQELEAIKSTKIWRVYRKLKGKK